MRNFSYRNKAAIRKQLWAIALKKERLWVQWLHAYYIKNDALMRIPIPKNASWMLEKILKVRELIHEWGSWQDVATSTKFYIPKAYSKLMGKPRFVQWSSLITHNRASLKSLFIVWMMAHRRLPTTDRHSRWGINYSLLCQICGKANESHHHIFIEYEFTCTLRSRTMAMMQYDNRALCLENELIRVSKICKKRHWQRSM